MAKKIAVFDIETNGGTIDQTELPVLDKINMIVIKDFHKGQFNFYCDSNKIVQYCRDKYTSIYGFGDIRDGIDKLRTFDVIVGHNICCFDIPVINSLFAKWYYDSPIKKSIRVIDTLVVSWLLHPDRHQHSLESWAKSLETEDQKVQVTSWDRPTENMADRCLSDVGINSDLLREFIKELKEYNEQGIDWFPAIHTEQAVRRIHRRQLDYGMEYDINGATELLLELDTKIKSLEDKIVESIQKKIIIPGKPNSYLSKVKEAKSLVIRGTKALKKNEEHTIRTVKYFKNTKHPIESVKGDYVPVEFVPGLKLSSDKEVKDYLKTLGWRPDSWNTKRLPNGKIVKKSPKLTESSFGSLKGSSIGMDIKMYRTLRHRRGLIQTISNPTKGGALNKICTDGRIRAEAITCGTPTARYRHQGAVCNNPRPSSLYGKEIRSLYLAGYSALMVGGDLSGIEARMLVHFCYNLTGGKDFAKLVLHGDWHSENAKLWDCTRDDAKTELYALMYNAGPTKLGNILGRGPAEGKANKERFMGKYKCYHELVMLLEREFYENGGYIRGIDGRLLFVRNKKDVLNTCLQGNSAIIFKNWMIECDKKLSKVEWESHQVIAYHDEIEYIIKLRERSHNSSTTLRGVAEKTCSILEDTAREVGKSFNINVPIEAEAKYGNNWAEVH